MNTMSHPLVQCENLVKIHQVAGLEVVALQGLNLTIQKGEMIGIVGASGSGKSTLLNVLGGLERPSAGRVVVNHRELLKMSDAELDAYRRDEVGFVWQQTTRNLLPYLSALENVELPLSLIGRPRRERRERAKALLDSLGLANRLHHRPAHLSGGEQQRVAIGVALAHQPQILLADEPTGEVDSVAAQAVFNAFRRGFEVDGTTIIIVSHDTAIHHYVDRVVAIHEGRIGSETIRHVREATVSEHTRLEIQSEARTVPSGFDELIVLDAAGRLQIPRHFLEASNMGDRAQLEISDGRLILRPVSGRGPESSGSPETGTRVRADELYLSEDAPPQLLGRPSILHHIRRAMSRSRFAKGLAKRL